MTMTDAAAGPRNTGAIAARRRDASSTPAWAAVSAWGAALLELALGAGALAGAESTTASRGVGVVLLTFGAAGLVWGTATLGRGRVVTPRAGVAGALLGFVAVAGALLTQPSTVSVVAVGAAMVLLLAVGVACASALRRRSPHSSQPRLTVLLASAVVVAAIVTPALGATEAGQLAPDHSDHGITDPAHH